MTLFLGAVVLLALAGWLAVGAQLWQRKMAGR